MEVQGNREELITFVGRVGAQTGLPSARTGVTGEDMAAARLKVGKLLINSAKLYLPNLSYRARLDDIE